MALESLRLPKFLRMDVFVWPFLLLGAGVVGGLGIAASAGRRPAIVGGVVAHRGRHRRLHRAGRDGPPERRDAMPSRCGKSLADGEAARSSRTRNGSRTASKPS